MIYPDSPFLLAAREVARDDDVATAAPVGAERDFSVRLLRTFLRLCESPRTRDTMLRMVRASVGNARAGQAFYRLLNRTVITPTAKATGVHASALRFELVCGQLVGLAMMRYVIEVEPVASAETEELVLRFAPAIRATLQG